MMRLVSGLLFSVVTTVSSTLQARSDDLPSIKQNFFKRTTTPIEKGSSSSQAQFESYHPFVSDGNTYPSDYIRLMKKTIKSGFKDRGDQFINDATLKSEKAQKWLDRAELSLTDNHEGAVREGRKYHRKANLDWSDDGTHRSELRFKEDLWHNFYSKNQKKLEREMSKRATMIRYKNQISALAKQIRKAEKKKISQEVISELRSDLKRVMDMFDCWTDGGVLEQQALQCSKKEINLFLEAWKKEDADGNQGRFEEEMNNHTLNAVAWKIRAEKIKQKQNSRHVP